MDRATMPDQSRTRAEASGASLSVSPTVSSVCSPVCGPCETQLALIVAGLWSSSVDAHSIQALCRISPIGVAAPTFRRWCAKARIKAADVLRFARLLRAISLGAQKGTSPSVWMDLDPRTYRSLLLRAGLPWIGTDNRPNVVTFIGSQQLLRNELILDAVRDVLAQSANGPDRVRRRGVTERDPFLDRRLS